MKASLSLISAMIILTMSGVLSAAADGREQRKNILFIISDDLTYTALSCYGNTVCQTPSIDKLATEGVRFTRAYCQGTYCGPSRASFMSGYYPHAIKMLGYRSRGTDHDILDFCVRELGILGGGRLTPDKRRPVQSKLIANNLISEVNISAHGFALARVGGL